MKSAAGGFFFAEIFIMKIPFHIPFISGNEEKLLHEVIQSKQLSGNGKFTTSCHNFFTQHFKSHKTLLTSSCTDALEMSALLAEIKEGDEVIMPSFTFVSTANPFVLRGAKIVFADSRKDSPNMDAEKIEELITPKTKAIVVVHYAGISCDMEKILSVAAAHNLLVIEDAAQCIGSSYEGKPLGTFGNLGAISFHDTKNINCGEGGLLIINTKSFIEKSEIIWEKGTNRAAFLRGEIKKYEWVDTGSSYLPSELTAAFLFAQTAELEKVTAKRRNLWNLYQQNLSSLHGKIYLPVITEKCEHNGHIYFIVCDTSEERSKLMIHLKENGIETAFHYQALHRSKFFNNKHDGRHLPNADIYSDRLLRLPLYFDMKEEQVNYISEQIKNYFS